MKNIKQITNSHQFTLNFATNNELANICGPLDINLKQIEQAFSVVIQRRGHNFNIIGQQANQAKNVLYTITKKKEAPISLNEIQLSIIEIINAKKEADSGEREKNPIFDENFSVFLQAQGRKLRGRTTTQCQYLLNILNHDITFGVGPAGTGKTFLAVGCAINALNQSKIKKIILTRPAVEAGERLGFLPGDLSQKVDPYLRPLYDALYDLAGFEQTNRLFERQIIEIAPLAYMRGRTLNDSFIILDEAQNTTPEQMKMFLTRIGFGSKAVITGDITQTDLPPAQQSGLRQALIVLNKVTGIAITNFSGKDVVRHPLVAQIVEAYNKSKIIK